MTDLLKSAAARAGRQRAAGDKTDGNALVDASLPLHVSFVNTDAGFAAVRTLERFAHERGDTQLIWLIDRVRRRLAVRRAA